MEEVVVSEIFVGAAMAPERRRSNRIHIIHRTKRRIRRRRSTAALISPIHRPGDDLEEDINNDDDMDMMIPNLPDECLAYIFKFLGSRDRKNCSLVCRHWFRVEGQNRCRLSLKGKGTNLHPAIIHSLFTRFDAVTKLDLNCHRGSFTIGDEAFVLISLQCRNLSALNLSFCLDLTDEGIAAFAINCKGLKRLSCDCCDFGAKGINAFLHHCSSLEHLSIKDVQGLNDYMLTSIGVTGSSSLKSLCIEGLLFVKTFAPLILGSKNLRTLVVCSCLGDWDELLKDIVEQVTGLVEIHLESIKVSDVGLAAISANCSDLEILNLVRNPRCTNTGLVSIAHHCNLLRKLYIHGSYQIGEEGLSAIAKGCLNLEDLVLVAVNPTCLSLGLLAANCHNLERFVLCRSKTFGDAEFSCIAAPHRCMAALRRLCIAHCPAVTDRGMETLLCGGCPNLVQLKVWNCWGVTLDSALRLMARRVSLAVDFDNGEEIVHPGVSNQNRNRKRKRCIYL